MKKVLLAAIAALALFALPSIAGAYPSSPPSFNSSNDACFDSANNVARPLACDVNGNQSVNVQNSSLVPSTATIVAASVAGAAGAATSTSLPGVASKTTCVRGFAISVGAATTAGTSACTVSPASGTIAGATALNYELQEGTTTAPPGEALIQSFPEPLCASAQNVAINISCGAVTSGGVIAIEIHGWQQ